MGVTHCDQVKRLVDAAVQTYGRVDVMLNDAGPRARCGPARRMRHARVQGKGGPELACQFERFGK